MAKLLVGHAGAKEVRWGIVFSWAGRVRGKGMAIVSDNMPWWWLFCRLYTPTDMEVWICRLTFTSIFNCP